MALPTLPDDTTLTRLLAASAEASWDKPMLRVKRGGSWVEFSYGAVLTASQRLAQALVQEGYAAGERAILFAESQPEWAIAYFGCVASGLTVVPLDPQTPAQEVSAVASFTESRLIFLSDEILECARGDKTAFTRSCSHPIAVRTLGEVGSLVPASPVSRMAEAVIDRGTADSPASIIFTAGTTVDPKGVVLTHRNFLANVVGVSSVLEPYPNDELISVLPLNHAFEFTNDLLIPIYAGATVNYVGTLKPRTILDAIDEVNATVLLGMPRLFQMFAEIVRRQGMRGRAGGAQSLRTLFGERMRVLVSGGAALDPDVYDAFAEAGLPIHEGYGLTETAPVLAVNPLHETRRGSVGKPIPGVEIRIEGAGADGIGEIVARGANIMEGYFRNPAATKKALRDGWLYTGDLGFLDADGFLHITGRNKDVIVTSAGKNVYPNEVELLYKGLPYVREMCVVGIKDEQRREEVHAILVVSREVSENGERQREIHLAMQDIGARIPSYQRIQHVHYWTRDLPKTNTMTVKRDEVRNLALSGGGTAEPEAGVEKDPDPTWVQAAWHAGLIEEIARLAGVQAKTIRPGHDFDRDLNLDSLMKVELLAILESNFNMTLPDHIALKFQTVQDVIDYLAPHMDAESSETPRFASRALTLDALPAKERESQYLNKTLLQRTARRLFRIGTKIAYSLFFHLKAEGLENLPQGQPFIIASNHASHLDSGAILTLLGKNAENVHVLGAKDYFFDSQAKAWIVSTFLNVLPFDRYGDFVRSLGLSQRAVQMGRSLLIFPEGTRSRDGQIQPFKPGLGLLALELGVPIVPAYIHGTYQACPKGQKFPKPYPVQVVFGKPLHLDAYLERARVEPHYPIYREITHRVQEEVVALRDTLLINE